MITNALRIEVISLIRTRQKSGKTIITSLLYETAAMRSPCMMHEKALVIPHPGHSIPRRFLKTHMAGPSSIISNGIIDKKTSTKTNTDIRTVYNILRLLTDIRKINPSVAVLWHPCLLSLSG